MKSTRAIPESVRLKLNAQESAAIQALTNGTFGLNEWRYLWCMADMTERLARENVGPEALPAALSAKISLEGIAERFKSRGAWGVSGTQLAPLWDCQEYHDLQKQSIPRSRYEQLARECEYRSNRASLSFDKNQ